MRFQKLVWGVFLGLGLSGCGAREGGIAAPLQASVAGGKRQLMAALDRPATMWGLNLTEEQSGDWTYPSETLAQMATFPQDGRFSAQSLADIYWVLRHYWRVRYEYVGEGEITYVGRSRFYYRVPEGRMLVITQVDHPRDVVINGFRLQSESTRTNTSPLNRASVHYPFSPGEILVLSLQRGAGISGYTMDPAWSQSRDSLRAIAEK